MKTRSSLLTALVLIIAASFPVSALELTGRKVVIDPGHGGSDPGALGIDGAAYPNEEDFNLLVGLKLRTLLQNAGCAVVMTRTTDATVSLTARRDLANSESPNAFIVIHCNSASGTTAVGSETFWCLDYCNGTASQDQDLATKVQSRLIQFLGRPNRGVKRQNFTVVSAVPPSCLGEMLFISTQAEFDIINTGAGQDNAAKAFFYGAMDRIGVTAPAAPSGLSATAVSSSRINLSWTDNSGIEDSFKIERATASGGPWTEIGTVAANVKTYASTGLSGGTPYYYRVRAYDSTLGNSSYSGTASDTTPTSGGPSITTHPASRAVDPGVNVTLTVVATGNAPLYYQWRKNGANLSNSTKFSGVTTAALTITNVQQTDVGNYSVIVSNAISTATSSSAALTVNAVIAFNETFESGLANWTVFPSPATALAASTAQAKSGSQSAYVDTSTDRMYRGLGLRVDGRLRITAWVYDSGQTRSFVDVRGYSGGSFNSGSLVQLLCAGKYNSVTLAGETWDNTKYQGRIGFATNTSQFYWFNLNGAGAPSRSAGWHKFVIERRSNGTTVDFYVDDILCRTMTGATLGSLDTAAIGSVGSGTATAGDSWIDDVKVEYFDLPVITTPPVNRTNIAGSTATFSVVAANTVGGYQWRRNGENLANGGKISGATTATLTLSNVQDADVASYDVVVSNGAGPVNSAAATLSVSPAITTPPASRTNIPGSTATFTVAAAGQTPIGYAWRKNGAPLTDEGRITGTTTDTLTIGSLETGDAGSYSAVAYNAAGSATSAVATLTIALPPAVTNHPVSQFVAAGANVTFTATVEGTAPLAYQWQFNEDDIPGATGTSLTLTNVQSTNAGFYNVEVSSPHGTAVSDSAELRVNNPPALTPVPDQTLHAGGIAAATVLAADGDAGQTLTFSLNAGAPATAAIDPANGHFTWPTTSGDAGVTRLISVTVADDGIPSLSDTITFNVTVAAPLLLQGAALSDTNLVLTWGAISGQTYRVEYKDTLEGSTWNPLPPDVIATAGTAAKSDPLGPTRRFYRVISVD